MPQKILRVVFAATHVSRRPTRHSMPHGRYSRWSRLRHGEVPPRYRALLARRDSDPLLCGFFLLLVFVLGHRDPRACLFAGATVVSPLCSHTHVFPHVFLSLIAAFRLPRRMSMQQCSENTLEFREMIDPQPHLLHDPGNIRVLRDIDVPEILR